MSQQKIIKRLSNCFPNYDIISEEKKFPNSLFIHGDADDNVDYSENPVMLNKLLSDIGANSKLNPLAGVGHATYEHGEELGLIIAKFLD